MKILIASDLHGDSAAVAHLLEIYRASGAEEMVLLGDLLYHGPRNDLPPAYAPREVIALLSALEKPPICVRGNCDAEVDQMVLPFPIMAGHRLLSFDGIRVFATHGHHESPENLPIGEGYDALLYGHTHIPEARRGEGGTLCLNPGSTTLPKGGYPPSYMLYENGTFTVLSLTDGAPIFSITA